MSIEQVNMMADWLLDGLVRASCQGGIAILIVWVVCQAVPKLPARAKCWLWRLAILKMVVALFWVGPLELALLPAPAPAVALPVEMHSAVAPEKVFTLPTAEEKVVQKPVVSLHWKNAVFFVWAVGCVLGLAGLALQYRKARSLRRTSSPCSEEQLLQSLSDLCQQFKLRRIPGLNVSVTASRPLLVGFYRPTLIFPEAIIGSSSPEALRIMLAHELAHIKRRDLLWIWVVAMVQIAFFFHPLLWLARRESVLAQEMACDELAIKVSSSPVKEYAEVLLHVVSLPLKTTPKFISVGIAEGTKTLERRIKSMKFIAHSKSWWMRMVATLILTASVLALIPMRLTAAKPDSTARLPEDSLTREKSTDEQIDDVLSGSEIKSDLNSETLLEKLRALPRSELRKVLPTLIPDRNLERYLEDLSKAEQQSASMVDDFSEEHPERRRVAEIMKTIDRQIEDRIDGILTSLELQVSLAKAESGKNPPPREASERLPVRSRVSGIVEKVLVSVGETVKAGQVLIEIDSSDARARLRTAEARFKVSQADNRISKTELEQTAREYAKQNDLIGRGLAPVDSLPNLEKARAYLARSEAMLQVAQSELEQTKLELDRFWIKAPRAGVVTSIIHEGYWVPEGGGKILAQIAVSGARAQSNRKVELLQVQLADQEKILAELLVRYREKHPKVQETKRLIDSLNQRLDAEKTPLENSAPENRIF